MTTDESPLREKIGQPEGEVEVIEVGVNYQDIKRIIPIRLTSLMI